MRLSGNPPNSSSGGLQGRSHGFRPAPSTPTGSPGRGRPGQVGEEVRGVAGVYLGFQPARRPLPDLTASAAGSSNGEGSRGAAVIGRRFALRDLPAPPDRVQ